MSNIYVVHRLVVKVEAERSTVHLVSPLTNQPLTNSDLLLRSRESDASSFPDVDFLHVSL